MIKAQLFYQEKQQIAQFRISGHAGYAPAGQDIVCAAVSFLATTVVNSIEQLTGKAGIVQCEDGFLSYQLPADLTESEMATAQIALQMLSIGLKDLKTEYPKYISIQKLKIKGGAQ